MNAITKKNTGSYYTSKVIADFITKWAIELPDICVLEPSFGDGIFIDSAISRFKEIGEASPTILGVEIQEEPYLQVIERCKTVMGFQMDFMDFRTDLKINAVIGNPPYVSLRHLTENQRKKALELIASYGVKMQSSGSMWMPFIIHATELLQENGKLGFVLPYEITYVRYAFDLWNYLSENYGKLTLCRIYHDFFPDVDVETIIFLAEEKGRKTSFIHYDVFETVIDLYNGKALQTSQVSINDIISLDKPFERELMPKTIVSHIKHLQEQNKIESLVNACKFKIGYVCGNKQYFHLSEEEVKQYGFCKSNVRKCLINSKQISSNLNIGIETSAVSNYSYLFYPVKITEREDEYIKFGEKQEINNAYKCRVRNPWYLTPGLEIPNVILTVFGNTPKLLLNNGNYYVSNSLLSGFVKVENAKELICRWYNSLTLLSIETTIHSLGGGTLVLIPGETDKLSIISDFPSEMIESTYKKINLFAKEHPIEEVYKYGDTVVLKEIYGFSQEEINEIENSLTTLRNWRTPEKRRG